MPITPISKIKQQGSLGSYYACSSYTAINPEFGNESDFEKMIEYAHQLGFKVIIDWVANHTGCQHEWTKNKDWYIIDDNENFTERNGWIDVIDLNYNNAAMQQAMIIAMQYWITRFNIDGFRCDMAHLVPLQFWRNARTQCDAIKPLYWLAECENVDYCNVFDTTYAWAFMHASEKAKQQNNVTPLIEIIEKYLQYPHTSNKLYFTTNHDENSWNGTEYEKYGDAAKAFAVLCCTLQGTPLLYSGQELPNKKRLQFFDKDEIEWTENIQLEKFYKNILALHKTHVVQQGNTVLLNTHNPSIIAFVRLHQSAVMLVVLNIGNANKNKCSITHQSLHGKFKNVFSNMQFQFNTTISFELQAGEYIVYEKMNIDI
jgi:glycosidase